MGTCAKGSSIELSQNCISAKTINMATTVIEQSEDSTKLKFSLPSVVYSGSSLTLSSAHELVERKYPGPFWSYLVSEAPVSRPEVLPSASNLTSMTFMGDRINHPQFRMRIHQILQHRPYAGQ